MSVLLVCDEGMFENSEGFGTQFVGLLWLARLLLLTEHAHFFWLGGERGVVFTFVLTAIIITPS
jgi:hypothetical protein